MITTDEASRAIAAAMPVFDGESVPLARAAGRILRQSVSAERDQPPFDRVTMDGIAVSFDAFAGGTRRFAVQGTQHAGDPVMTLADSGNCIEIMTGAVMPVGCDCVVPVERIEVRDGSAQIEDDYDAARGQFIHVRGSDYRLGDELLTAGHAVSPMDVAIIASCGLDSVVVARSPSIRVISTGNELVPPGAPIAPHQIRLSNGPAIVAMLERQGFENSQQHHLVDEPEVLRSRLAGLLEESDLLILSGGVSMGKADFVPQVLSDLGVSKTFHKISQRPGKPMWFGTGRRGQAVFALPGNPVSALVCCRQYVLPAMFAASGRPARPVPTAILTERFEFEPLLTCFLPVRLRRSGRGELLAEPAPTNTSGDFTSLSGTAGYVELARQQTVFEAGTVVPLHLWDHP